MNRDEQSELWAATAFCTGLERGEVHGILGSNSGTVLCFLLTSRVYYWTFVQALKYNWSVYLLLMYLPVKNNANRKQSL
jgi:hypothetical protein